MSITLTDEPQIIYPPTPAADRDRATVTAAFDAAVTGEDTK